ncbi:MAG: hypothetical protein WB245_08660 [Acidimicrobiia bacterium]
MGGLDLADGLRLIHQSADQDYFGHHSHLRFAWAVLDEASDVDEAERVVTNTIRHVTELHGNPAKYHHTVTVFWIHLLDHLRQTHPDVTDLDEMIEVYPDLGDPTLPNRHWSDLDTEQAKRTWVEPDLIPLP